MPATKATSARSRTGKARATGKKKPPPRAARKKDLPAAILQSIRQNILFHGVDPKVIAKNISGFSERRCKAGDVIFDEYTRGRELFLISSGRVRIKKYTKFGVESLLAVLHPGDFFGELSVIDGLPRSARAEAMDECEILAIPSATFRALVTESHAFAFNIMSNLGVRLRTMDQTFVLELGRSALASKNKMDKLHQLIEASKIVNSALDLDTLLGLILDVAASSVLADRGTLYLLDEAKGELWSKVMQGNNMVEIRLPLGKGLAGYVAKTGETVNIVDAYKDPRFNPEIDKKSGYKTRNVLCMPMRTKDGKIIGVFQFLNKKEGAFGPDDESFIDALSVHAAIALENARIAREMVQGERLSAVGRMASTIIHDIKNPMGTLRMYAQVIKKKTGDSESAQLAEEIIRQVDRFVNMTQEILDFSKGISEIHLEDVELADVLESLITFIEKDLGKRNITLARKFDYTGHCRLDLDKVSRAFYNLASNAADAMENGGTLTVTSRRQDGQLVIEFSDTGAGIPDEIRHKVFEPFFTAGKRHGTGLGLAIVKKIVDDHHGSIEFESEVNKGTTFRLFFPLA
jgi:CRP-like cAMP-binding protein/two-component sensor histidine kinase